jgi:hypothetical protein
MTYDQLRVDQSATANTRCRIPARHSWGKSDRTSVTPFVVRPQVGAQGFLDQLRQCRLPLQGGDAGAQLERRVDIKGDTAASTTSGPTHATRLPLFPGIRNFRNPVGSGHCLVYVYQGIMNYARFLWFARQLRKGGSK